MGRRYTGIAFSCLVCRAFFHRRPCDIRKLQCGGYLPKYCSLKCLNVGKIGQRRSLGARLKMSRAKDKGLTAFNLRVRRCYKYRQWRDEVFRRDDYRCQICDKRGHEIQADHIYPLALMMREKEITTFGAALRCESIWDVGNGRTLCRPCHLGTETFGRKLTP